MKNEPFLLSLSPNPSPFPLGGRRLPRYPLGLKALSDFRTAKVPGTAGRLMAAC